MLKLYFIQTIFWRHKNVALIFYDQKLGIFGLTFVQQKFSPQTHTHQHTTSGFKICWQWNFVLKLQWSATDKLWRNNNSTTTTTTYCKWNNFNTALRNTESKFRGWFCVHSILQNRLGWNWKKNLSIWSVLMQTTQFLLLLLLFIIIPYLLFIWLVIYFNLY